MSRNTLLALTLSAFALAACQSNEPEAINDERTTATTATSEVSPSASTSGTIERTIESRRDIADSQSRPSRQADPATEIPRLQGELDTEGYGMTMIIDGSSPAAFAESLEMIASDTSPEQFQRLDSSIRFLQAYALGVDNLTEFYQSLNGQTPEEIVERASQRNRR